MDSIQEQLNTFAHTFPRKVNRQALPRRLRCLLSDTEKVADSKKEEHHTKFQELITDLKQPTINGEYLSWSVSLHPCRFVKGDPAVAWAAVEALFSPTKIQ